MVNKRCKICNWENKDVGESFTCTNCGNVNNIIKQAPNKIINTAEKEEKY